MQTNSIHFLPKNYLKYSILSEGCSFFKFIHYFSVVGYNFTVEVWLFVLIFCKIVISSFEILPYQNVM